MSREKGNFGGSGKVCSRVEFSRIQKLKDQRKIMTGALPNFKFINSEEIDEYLSGDVVECLICGYKGKSLNVHFKCHDMTAREYKEAFGIPFSRAIVGKGTLNKMSNATTQYNAENPEISEIKRKKSSEWAKGGLNSKENNEKRNRSAIKNSHLRSCSAKTYKKKCPQCGGDFEMKGYRGINKMYCSQSCAMRATAIERWKKKKGSNNA